MLPKKSSTHANDDIPHSHCLVPSSLGCYCGHRGSLSLSLPPPSLPSNPESRFSCGSWVSKTSPGQARFKATHPHRTESPVAWNLFHAILRSWSELFLPKALTSAVCCGFWYTSHDQFQLKFRLHCVVLLLAKPGCRLHLRLKLMINSSVCCKWPTRCILKCWISRDGFPTVYVGCIVNLAFLHKVMVWYTIS